MKKILLLATCVSFFTAISYADEVEYYYKRVPIEFDLISKLHLLLLQSFF